MIIVYILLGLVVLLFLLLLLPAHIAVTFDGSFQAGAGIGPVVFRLYPPKEEKKKKKKEISYEKPPKKSKKEEGVRAASELERLWKEEGWQAALSYLCRMASFLLEAFQRFLDILVIDRLNIQLRVASGDADITATDYGKACGVLYPVLALIKSRVRVRREQLSVQPDFIAEKTEFRLEFRAHVILIKVLWQGLRLLMRFLVHTSTDGTAEPAGERMIDNGRKK